MASVFKRGGNKNRGGKWYIQWYDHNGKRHTKSSGTTDKATAERIGNKFEAESALRRDGVIDPTLDAISKESQRGIESHLENFENKLRGANRSEDHVTRTVGVIRKISAICDFTIAIDINADAVNGYARRLKDQGRSARTIQSHLTAIKSFTRWLTEHDKLQRDPLSSIRKPNPKSDRRLERRMLLPEEWPWLKLATESGPERHGMTGHERLLLYRTAIQTGLRSTELRSLKRGNLYVAGEVPYITAKSSDTKNRKMAQQFIRPELAADLRVHIRTKSPKASVFSMPDRTEVAGMIRADLAAARKMWLDEPKDDPEEIMRRSESDFLTDTNHSGEVFDFHCLRHTCGAWLALANVHPKTIQSIMRHCTITLTMDTYGHVFPGQEADAVARFGDILDDVPELLLATGTDGAPCVEAQLQAQQSGRERVRDGCDAVRDGRSSDSDVDDDEKPRNSLTRAKICEEVPDGSPPCDSGRRGARTLTPITRYGILSPVRLPIPPSGQGCKYSAFPCFRGSPVWSRPPYFHQPAELPLRTTILPTWLVVQRGYRQPIGNRIQLGSHIDVLLRSHVTGMTHHLLQLGCGQLIRILRSESSA